MAREIADLPALEAALRKKAEAARADRRAEMDAQRWAIHLGEQSAHTDAADMVAAMMREGGDGTQHD